METGERKNSFDLEKVLIGNLLDEKDDLIQVGNENNHKRNTHPIRRNSFGKKCQEQREHHNGFALTKRVAYFRYNDSSAKFNWRRKYYSISYGDGCYGLADENSQKELFKIGPFHAKGRQFGIDETVEQKAFWSRRVSQGSEDTMNRSGQMLRTSEPKFSNIQSSLKQSNIHPKNFARPLRKAFSNSQMKCSGQNSYTINVTKPQKREGPIEFYPMERNRGNKIEPTKMEKLKQMGNRELRCSLFENIRNSADVFKSSGIGKSNGNLALKSAKKAAQRPLKDDEHLTQGRFEILNRVGGYSAPDIMQKTRQILPRKRLANSVATDKKVPSDGYKIPSPLSKPKLTKHPAKKWIRLLLSLFSIMGLLTIGGKKHSEKAHSRNNEKKMRDLNTKGTSKINDYKSTNNLSLLYLPVFFIKLILRIFRWTVNLMTEVFVTGYQCVRKPCSALLG